MAVHHILEKNIIWWDDRSRLKYWPLISNYISTKYSQIDKSEQEETKTLLKDCFSFFSNEFSIIISDEKNIAFYCYVFGLHNIYIELWEQKSNGISIEPFERVDFAIYGRVLKLILEQASGLKLLVGDNIPNDILKNKETYREKLEDLIFIGDWLYGFAEYVAHIDLMGPIHDIEISVDGMMSILTHPIFQFLIDEIEKDNHNHELVTDINCGEDLRQSLINSFGVDHLSLLSLLEEQNDDAFTWKLCPLVYDKLKSAIMREHYNETDVNFFLEGLTISKKNKMSIEDAILKPQNINRYKYKPILKFETSIGKLALISSKKYWESFFLLATDAIPWGEAPEEWTINNSGIKKYVERKKDNHDKTLEDEVEKILKLTSTLYDNNITSFNQNKKRDNNITCDIEGVGQMDFIFIKFQTNELYILECKHNRRKSDMVSWRKEFSNFYGYEKTLNRKIQWITNNINIVNKHFNLISAGDKFDISTFEIKGAFLINAPNFYLYNGSMPCFTLTTLEQMLIDKDLPKQYTLRLEGGTSNRIIEFERPYFSNAFQALQNIGDL